jgi:hypothetical protein
MPKAEAEALKATAQFHIEAVRLLQPLNGWLELHERRIGMIFVLKRTPAFQPFGSFQNRSQVEKWIKQHANQFPAPSACFKVHWPR